ncbi:MAG: ribosome recycling factor [Chlamydiales bacterium]|jgi:ribosome recycling factor
MSYKDILSEAETRMEKAMTHLQETLRGIRTSRASGALVENIRVDYYGTLTPLIQLAAISIPEARTIAMKPFDAAAVDGIMKALQKSNLGIAPDTDGKVVRLSLPPLSGEQRQKYAAKAKEMCEEGRISMRNVRRDVNKQADGAKKDGELTEDENRQLHDEIQKMLKSYEDKVTRTKDSKEKEILEV